MMIRQLETDNDILSAYPVMKQLRPHLSETEYAKSVKRMMDHYGYRLTASMEDVAVRAVAGYRISESLAWGKYLYVDDLVTKQGTRSQGHGKRLLDWLKREAKKHGCDMLHLDSGVQRHDAHRFYLRERMDIKSFHFSISLDEKK